VFSARCCTSGTPRGYLDGHVRDRGIVTARTAPLMDLIFRLKDGKSDD
jgi:hypothetical protein